MSVRRECNISHARHLTFREFARVSLDDLSFGHDSARSIDERNVFRLRKIFEIEGCQRSDGHNFIDATAAGNAATSFEPEQLPLFKIPADNWCTVPLLKLGAIACLNGQHRIEAAKRYLAPNDRWWIVRIFVDGQYIQWCHARG